LSIVTVVVVGIPRPVGVIVLFIGISSLLSFCTLLPAPELC
jgi:hypothetical protein